MISSFLLLLLRLDADIGTVAVALYQIIFIMFDSKF